MLVGYARVSTQEQDLALQLDALKAVGCEKIFEEKASGAQRERPEPQAALGYMRASDTLVVWKLDRLARSLKQLIETVEDLGTRAGGLPPLRPRARAACRPASVRSRMTPRSNSARAANRWNTSLPPEVVVSIVSESERKPMPRDPEITVVEVARRLGVVPSTLYRHLPRARTAALEV
jgi:hypothetical protein